LGGGSPARAATTFALLIAFAATLFYLYEPSTSTVTITPEIEIDRSSPAAIPTPAASAPPAQPAASTEAPVSASAPEVAALRPSLPSSLTALLQTWYAKLAAPPTQRWGVHPLGWLLFAAGLAWGWRWLARPRAQVLARVQTREVLREQQLHAPAPASTAPPLAGHWRDDVREAARRLRRPVTPAAGVLRAAALDVPATVRASAGAGGRFVPVAKAQRVARRLVVLIDRARADEPLGLLAERLVRALADEGVAVVTRHFDRDPRRALAAVGSGGVGDVLVLCSDGRGLLDARDGALRPWVGRSAAGARRVLLTPVPMGGWGEAEARLAGEGGFVVLPMLSWALPVVLDEAPVLPFVAGVPTRWPALLQGQALRWLSPTWPVEADVAALLRQLRGLLGARGFGWLAACAAYPHLSLGLAQYLAAELEGAEASGGGGDDDARVREAQWLALAHLPWLRQGWMPDWLRLALLRELSAGQRARLSAALQALLSREGAGGIDLGRIATPYRRRQFWGWFTRWLPHGEPAGSPLRDVIYLGVLDGRIDEMLKQAVDAETAGRLRQRSQSKWRRSLRQGVMAVPVAAVMVWGVVMPYWPSAVVSAKTPEMAAGTRFRDCKDESCPWMRVIPAGIFMMGSPETESGRMDREGPQHRVTIAKPFAVMETEVTVALFKAFVAATKYQTSGGCYAWNGSKWELDAAHSWRKPFADAEQDDRHPVVCVTWDDAQAFVKWMSLRTGQVYRLLTEAEWEYAARAGSTTRYSFSDNDADLCRYANVADQRAKRDIKGTSVWTFAPCDDGFAYTAPVGSYQANAFKLRDMYGNAWEWTKDCWHGTYENAPINGESWEKNCTEARRVLRGGSWFSGLGIVRSAHRDRDASSDRYINLGFRIARTFSF
jgi:formylglycine-generating enzyme required for sulfatase activity